MEIEENDGKKVPETTVVLGRRKKPRPGRMSETLTEFMNRVTMESYGKLLTSTGESPSTDKVDVAGDLVINFIDIGQGNCTFIECPGGETILIDCGSVTKGPPKDEIAALARDYITSRLTKNTLDYLIISHPDQDHMNLVDKVLAGVTVTKLLCGGRKKGDYSGKGKDNAKDFLAKLVGGDLDDALINGGGFYMEPPGTEEKNRLIQCKHGLDAWVVCANADTIPTSAFKEKLHISGVEKLVAGTDANTACIVVCLRYQNRQVLICGDATFSTEYAILASDWGKGALKCDALEGGHHGSADSFSDEFLSQAQPSWVHFSADNKGTFRHPTWETVQRVLTCCPQVKSTYEYGPHGIVIGPKKSVGLEYQEKKKEFIEKTPRVAAVLDLMKEKSVDGKAALQALLPVWFKEGEWKKEDPFPPKPIQEQWVLGLLNECTVHRSMENDLVTYWADRFNGMAEEQKRLEGMKDELDQEKYFWDWAVLDFNLFTTLTTANLGVYWILTITKAGDVVTDLA